MNNFKIGDWVQKKKGSGDNFDGVRGVLIGEEVPFKIVRLTSMPWGMSVMDSIVGLEHDSINLELVAAPVTTFSQLTATPNLYGLSAWLPPLYTAPNARTEDLAEQVSSIPTVATPAPHSCSDNRKTYDSGWSKYDYCAICDTKLDEILVDRS